MSDKVCYAVYHPFRILSISLLFAKLFHFLASRKRSILSYVLLSPFLATFLLAALPLNAGGHGVMCTKEDIEVK